MSAPVREYDAIVLGLGGIGSAAAYWLSRRLGERVLGIEQFPLGHERGGSQDHSRIIRLSYHTPTYVRLAKRAYECWAELERESGEEVVLETGGLDFAPRDAAIPLSDYTDSLDAEGVDYEPVDAAEIRHRWPVLEVPDDVHGICQDRTGIAKAAIANAAHRRMAKQHGATLLAEAPVTDISSSGGEVTLTAGGSTYRTQRLVLAAGAWSNTALGHLGHRLPLEVTQEQVTYFASPQLDRFRPGEFPTWIWMDDPCFYGFPVFGEPAVKIAQDAGGRVVTAETRSFEPDPENFERVREFAQRIMPAAVGPVLYTKTCLYTLTPDRDFVIDAVPGHPGVHVAIGAGHAFKFASVIGRVLSELALDGATPTDLSPFGWDRPILHAPDPPRSYMV